MEPLTIPRRSEIIRAHQARGGRIAAVLPIHYPRALFRAFDLLPVEVWGPPRVDPTLGSAHLQPYVCSIVRNALSFLLADGLAVADAIVIPHTCDSLQGFASILIDFVQPQQPVLPIYLPRGNRASDRQFLADEFRSLYRALAEITQRNPSDADLMACIEREERADDLLAQLHRNRQNIALTQIDLYRLIRSREYLPAEIFIDIVGATLWGRPVEGNHPSTLLRTGSGLPLRTIPIILSGIIPEPMTIFDALAQMNAHVVADDFACCGRRLYPRGTSTEPFTRMAERILNAPPDSTRGSAIADRLAHLKSLTQSTGAKGIVFYDVKFCEPELFYLPALRQGLQQAGIPSAAIEFDLNDTLSQQTQTRLEAFVEMIAL